MGTKLPKGQAAFNDVLINYKIRAKRKSIEFKLSKEQFRELTSRNCIYCNSVPNQNTNRPHSNPKYKHAMRFNGDYIYNGIDRKDPKIGYIFENCVPCCGSCNTIKNDVLTYDEMIVVMKTLLEYRKIQNG